MGTVAGAHGLAVPENGRHNMVLREEGRLDVGDSGSGQLGARDLQAQDTWVEWKWDVDHVTARDDEGPRCMRSYSNLNGSGR
jgi:hypothetical protein